MDYLESLTPLAKEFLAQLNRSFGISPAAVEHRCSVKGIRLSRLQREILLAVGGLSYSSNVSFGPRLFEASFFEEWTISRPPWPQIAFPLGSEEFAIGYCCTDEAFEPDALWLLPDGSLTMGTGEPDEIRIYESLSIVLERDAFIHSTSFRYQGCVSVSQSVDVERLLQTIDGTLVAVASDCQNKVITGKGFVCLWQRWYSALLSPRAEGWKTVLRIFSDSEEPLHRISKSLQPGRTGCAGHG